MMDRFYSSCLDYVNIYLNHGSQKWVFLLRNYDSSSPKTEFYIRIKVFPWLLGSWSATLKQNICNKIKFRFSNSILVES